MKIHTLRYHATSPASGGAVRVDFQTLTDGRPVRFRAGQHGLWQIPGGGVHPFTIASAPEEHVVTLGTSLSSASRLKQAIGSLADGDRVRLLAPLADFTVDHTSGPLVLLAQGLGVTPFRSILRHLDLTGQLRWTTLLQVGAEHVFRSDTEPLATTSAFVDSREQYADLLGQVAFDQPASTFLVSGSPTFVSSTVGSLRDRGVAGGQVHTDKFWGYHPPTSADAVTA